MGIEVICSQCGIRFSKRLSECRKSRHGKFFCSRLCKDNGQSLEGLCPEIRPSHYDTGKHSYRRRAFKKYGKICSRCGYGEHERMLDVHHKDKNRAHNQITNLEVLCVWCHALETRGLLAQSGERRTCNAEAGGAEPPRSTK